jgi:hypothetical protein
MLLHDLKIAERESKEQREGERPESGNERRAERESGGQRAGE